MMFVPQKIVDLMYVTHLAFLQGELEARPIGRI